MTRYRLPALCLLLACSVGFAADPAIRLPVAPVLPQPMPAPVEPGGVLRLGAEELYAVESDVELADILTFPDGLVSFEKAAPGTFYGKFAGGGGRWGKRELKGPFVYLGTATGKGRASVAFVPVGVKTKADIVRAVIDADSGQGPIPPPTPVEPKVEPKPAATFRVLFVYESGDTLTAAQNGVLYAKSLADYLDARCTKDGPTAGWRRRDKDASADAETPGIKTLWAAVKPHLTATPCLVIEADGKADILPLPATAADALATLKKYAGDK